MLLDLDSLACQTFAEYSAGATRESNPDYTALVMPDLSPEYSSEQTNSQLSTVYSSTPQSPYDSVRLPKINCVPISKEISDLLKNIFAENTSANSAFDILTSANLKNFLADNPQPEKWFAQFFSYINQSEIRTRATPIGIVFELEGSAYKQFVSFEGIRSNDNEPVSLGVNLCLNRLPRELHNLFVVVNRGDRQPLHNLSCEQQITDTGIHELLHIVFNRFFSKAPFVDYIQLDKMLSEADKSDLDSIKQIAKALSDGLVEISRSEVISYFATGYYNVELTNLCAHFWKLDAQIINKHLAGCSEKQQQEICEIFFNACRDYARQTNEYLDFAGQLIQDNPQLPKSEIAAHLLAFSTVSNDSSNINSGRLAA